MKKLLKQLLVLSLFCLAIGIEVSLAQPIDYFKATGIVTNNQGSISDAKITLTRKRKRSNVQRTTFTDSKGEFAIHVLPFGEYEVKTEFSCMERIDKITVNSGETVNLTIALAYEDCEEKSAREKENAAKEEAEWEVCKQETGVEKVEVSDLDKAEVVNQVLEDMLEYETYYDDGEITIFTENIKPEWVKFLPNLKINLLSIQEIQAKADKDGDFGYIFFDKWEAQNSCISIGVSRRYARRENSEAVTRCGNGDYARYLYRKVIDKWKRKSLYPILTER